MPDREKVIGHLNDCMEASRRENTWVFVRKDIVDDTIALLKEQEDLGTELMNAIELIHKKNERIEKLLKERERVGTWKQIDDDTNIWSCSECDEPFILMDGTPIENKYYYCPHCGAKMGT